MPDTATGVAKTLPQQAQQVPTKFAAILAALSQIEGLQFEPDNVVSALESVGATDVYTSDVFDALKLLDAISLPDKGKDIDGQTEDSRLPYLTEMFNRTYGTNEVLTSIKPSKPVVVHMNVIETFMIELHDSSKFKLSLAKAAISGNVERRNALHQALRLWISMSANEQSYCRYLRALAIAGAQWATEKEARESAIVAALQGLDLAGTFAVEFTDGDGGKGVRVTQSSANPYVVETGKYRSTSAAKSADDGKIDYRLNGVPTAKVLTAYINNSVETGLAGVSESNVAKTKNAIRALREVRPNAERRGDDLFVVTFDDGRSVQGTAKTCLFAVLDSRL